MKAITGLISVGNRMIRVEIDDQYPLSAYTDVEYADPSIYVDNMTLLEYREEVLKEKNSKAEWVFSELSDSGKISDDKGKCVCKKMDGWDMHTVVTPSDCVDIDYSMHYPKLKRIPFDDILPMVSQGHREWGWDNYLWRIGYTRIDAIFTIAHYVDAQYRCGYFTSIKEVGNVKGFDKAICDLVLGDEDLKLTPFNLIEFLKERRFIVTVLDDCYDVKQGSMGFKIGRGMVNVPIFAPVHMLMLGRMGYMGMIPYYYDDTIISKMLFSRGAESYRTLDLWKEYVYIARDVDGERQWYKDVNNRIVDQVLLCKTIVGKIGFETYFEIVFSGYGKLMKIVPAPEGVRENTITPFGYYKQRYVAEEVTGEEDFTKFKRCSFDDLLPVSRRNDMVSSSKWVMNRFKNNELLLYDKKINVSRAQIEWAVTQVFVHRLQDKHREFQEQKCAMVKVNFIVVKIGRVLRIKSGCHVDHKMIVPYYCQTSKLNYVDFLDEVYMEKGIKGCPEKSINLLPVEAYSCSGSSCVDECSVVNCYYEYVKKRISEYRKADISTVVSIEYLMWFYSGQSVEKIIRQGVREGLITKEKEEYIVLAVKDSGKASWDAVELTEAIERPYNFTNVRREIAAAKSLGDMSRVYTAMETDINSSAGAHKTLVEKEMAKLGEEYLKIKGQQATLILREENLRRCMGSDATFLAKLEKKRLEEVAKLRKAKVEYLFQQKRAPEGQRVTENSSHKRKYDTMMRKPQIPK